jgi:UDP-glucose 4-epimerase
MAHSEWEDAVRRRRIVVTGGAGFIGSHLVRALLAAGAAHVRVLDDLRCGDPANLGGATTDVELVRVRLGWDDPTRHLAGADVLFHLAAEKHNQALDRPADLLRANVEGTHQLLAAAARHGVRHVVFTSSLYAYGRMAGPPCTEDACPQPTTVYGISKLAGEHLLRHFAGRDGLPGTVLRLYFVYGPRQYAGMGYKSVIVQNFERLLAGQPAVVYGDGRQALDYVYVADVVEALLRALTPAAAGQVFNVASGTAVTVRDLVTAMATVAGAPDAPVFEAADWTAGTSRSGSAAPLAERPGCRPRTNLETGLGRTRPWLGGQRA